MAAILLVGIVAYTQLPVSALPQVDYPTIQVLTFYPGASPDVVATTVTAPLERQFGQLQGLSQMTSTSSGTTSVIVLQFNLSLSLDVAEEEVQSAINAAQSFLPSVLPAPPIYSKTSNPDAPVLTLVITSDSIPLSQVEDLADTRLAPKLSQLNGVGLVSISGGQKPLVRIQANPAALASYGLTLEQLRTALVQTSVNAAKGNFDGPRQNYQIDSNDQLQRSNDYKGVVVAYRNGAPVVLNDVAQVVDGVENNNQAAWMDQTPAVILNIQRQPGANTISVVKSIKNILPQLETNLPAGIKVTQMTDLTVPIEASVSDVEFELMLTVVLVVLVIFLFLRSIRATIIPAIAVPISLVGTLGAMYVLGYSLDNLSMMALTIATGFVVDDAIVMIENISRYLEEGDPPLQAALKGAEQIGFTILSLTVSLIAVLIPLLFMQDVVGRLFREFAVTLSVTILVSAVVSLTLTPMICSKILRHQKQSEKSWFYKASEDSLNWVIDRYAVILRFVLRHQPATLVVTVGTLALTIFLFLIIPKGFFPVQDTGVILGISEVPATLSFAAMAERQQALAKVILKDPDVVSLSSFIGIDGTNMLPNSGRIQINLKSRDRRTEDAPTIIRRLQASLADVKGINLYMQPVQDLTVEDRISRTQFQYTMEDADGQELSVWAPKLVDKLRNLQQLTDVASDQQERGMQATLTIDRDTASRLGILPQTIDDTLYDAFGQRQVSTIFTQLNQYHVILEVNPEFQENPDALKQIYVHSTTGTQMPLSAFTQYSSEMAPIAINHQGQFPVVTLSFNLGQGVSLGQAVDAMKLAQQEIRLPPSIHAGFQGTAAAFQASLANEPVLILAALLTVYIVLGVLYESYIHPITILSTLPSAGIGALLALLITKIDFSVIALIGIILLIGIVQKNAIMMIDFALESVGKGWKSPLDAIYQECWPRSRPFLKTARAAMLGGLPLASGSETGAKLLKPLGVA